MDADCFQHHLCTGMDSVCGQRREGVLMGGEDGRGDISEGEMSPLSSELKGCVILQASLIREREGHDQK